MLSTYSNGIDLFEKRADSLFYSANFNHIKVFMQRKIRYCDYGFIGKNF